MPVETVEVPVARPYPVVVGTALNLGKVVSEVLEPGLCAIAIVASWLPARRAAGLDPSVALRED